MTDNKQTGRYVAGKLALPAILVISLITARLIVGLRSALVLSDGIELSRSGLSVSMPSGNGWEGSGKWIYDDDRFVITATLSVDQLGKSYARCRYLLAAESLTPAQKFDEQAAEIDGQVIETGQLHTNQLTVDWARIQRNFPGGSDTSGPPDISAYEIISGICGLAGGRQLEIEVLTQDEIGASWDIFERIVKAVRFNDNGLLQAGEQLISEVKSEGLSDMLRNDLSPEGHLSSLFVILNNRGYAIGFTMEAAVTGNQTPAPVQSANYYYLRDPIHEEHVGFFRGDDALEKFTWRVESTSRMGNRGIEMTGESASADKGGRLTVRFATGRQGGEEKIYALGKAAVPDIVLEPVLKKLLDSPGQEIIVDVIRSDGTVTPVYIEKITPSGREKQYPGALRLEVLDERGYWQQIYYDNAQKPAKIILSQENTYTLQRQTANQVAAAFPERAEIVGNPGLLLEQNN